MRNRLIATVLVACIPAVSFAQRTRGGGDPSGSPASAPASGGSAKTPSSRDLSDLNPASLLIDKKKKASLADSTVAQLKAVEKKINERNAAFFASYDSTRKWTMPLASGSAASSRPGFSPGDAALSTSTSSTGEQQKMQASMRDLKAMMADFRERHNADVSDALGVVPDAQKKAATDLLDGQNKDVDKLVGGKP